MNTDAEWEKWGKNDPYFGVITQEKYRSQNLTEEAKLEFFNSGKRHITDVLEVCRRHFDHNFSPRYVLDFGCGVGRLVIPFAEIAEHVVGVDVSDSMLEEARKNCNEYLVQNITLLKSDDNLSSLDGEFDLIHSFIVFQHIPIERGACIFTNLLNHLKKGGICAIQITYSKAYFRDRNGVPPIESSANRMKRRLKRIVRRLLNIVKRRASDSQSQDPEMQMNPYNLNELFYLIQSAGIRNAYVVFTDHGGELGVYLYFQKPNLA